jgi:hypothetical protein
MENGLRTSIASSRKKQQKTFVLIWVPGGRSWNPGSHSRRLSSWKHNFTALSPKRRFLELAMLVTSFCKGLWSDVPPSPHLPRLYFKIPNQNLKNKLISRLAD